MPKDFAPVPDGELYYEETGSGPAVVLGHAGIADHTMWDGQVGPFSELYRVVRYDLRGFGQSSMPETDYAPHDDLRALLAHLDIDRAAVVGVSISGGIVVDFALAYPEMLWALVPVAAGIDGYDWSTDEALQRFGAEEKAALDAGEIDRAVELNVRLWVDGPGRTPDQVDDAIREKVRQMQRAIFERGEPVGQPLPLIHSRSRGSKISVFQRSRSWAIRTREPYSRSPI
jgi:pimeloyl-ACP methyl ester carboxylesterase